MINSTNLKMIEGGVKPKEDCEKIFESAYVTDTRLMGAMAMYIHWHVVGSPDATDLHQFFYIDAEETGLEEYKGIWNNDIAEVEVVENMMVDCLGGRRIGLSEEEARMLLIEYAEFDRSHDIELPEGFREYRFILDSKGERGATVRTDGDGRTNPHTPSEMNKAQAALFEKECADISSEYELINYFLMRCFAKDTFAARYLTGEEGLIPGPDTVIGTNDDMRIDLYSDIPAATLRKNTIDEKNGAFFAQSLIEYGGTYRIAVSKLKVEDMKIVRYERASGFRITPEEAAMQLARSEYVTVYELILLPGNEGSYETALELTFNSTAATHYDQGDLFLKFRSDNDHVTSRVFTLSDDIEGMYYLSGAGQLIAAAYSVSAIGEMEREVKKSGASPYILMSGRFEFKEPVVYEFINSGIETFDEFLDMIRDD